MGDRNAVCCGYYRGGYCGEEAGEGGCKMLLLPRTEAARDTQEAIGVCPLAVTISTSCRARLQPLPTETH